MEKVICIKTETYYNRVTEKYSTVEFSGHYFVHRAYRCSAYTKDHFGDNRYYIGIFENDIFVNLAEFREYRINKILE